MSRWDDASFDNERYNLASDNEETRLLKKFEAYKELEKTEFDKRNSPQIANVEKLGFFSRYIHAMAIIQGIIIAGFTTVLMFLEFISTDIKFSIISLAVVALAGEVVIISIYLRKKSSINTQKKSLMQFENRNEFERI
jgi:hypothetical protein